ncbi:hypothetical protein Nepgr_006848 [Nepenthes gracilis]|uniref:Uncharacterized protein n=1 Tax=Nepenthes gracilis TaxID=150966 RepID=A0AAD3XHR4_NEPGR|nr:hypothetical protein Nepgr_006848 [Nepenthes gracilis]
MEESRVCWFMGTITGISELLIGSRAQWDAEQSKGETASLIARRSSGKRSYIKYVTLDEFSLQLVLQRQPDIYPGLGKGYRMVFVIKLRISDGFPWVFRKVLRDIGDAM